MEQSRGFKHIMVTPPDEGDIVIHAGLTEEEEASPAAVSAPVPAPAPAPAEAATPPLRPAPKPDDSSREVSLEDLKGEPMPTAQRVVIVAALAIIAIALVYYFAVLA